LASLKSPELFVGRHGASVAAFATPLTSLRDTHTKMAAKRDLLTTRFDGSAVIAVVRAVRAASVREHARSLGATPVTLPLAEVLVQFACVGRVRW